MERAAGTSADAPLVLHGEGDRACPIALGHEMAAAIPGARFESLASANHVPLEYDLPAWFEPGAGQVKDLADDQGQVGQLHFGQRRPPG